MNARMKQVVLRAHPQGAPRAEDFAVEEADVPSAGPNQVLLRTLWLALDPLIRFALDPVPMTGPHRVRIGEPVYGGTVSQVVSTNHPNFVAGDYVEGRTGWREYAAVDPTATALRKLDPALAPLSTALGVVGMPGQTAHACMINVGRVAAGETVVMSAAGGAVGSTAGQIGKILGAKVIGIAGGAAKCAAVKALGFDDCVDYKAADFRARLSAACDGGVDVYVENVGGAVTEAVLPLLKYRARMPVCGFIAYYGIGKEGPGPDRLPGFMRTVMSKGLEVRGFGGAMTAGPEALKQLAAWVKEGRVSHPETIVDGIESAPSAFAGVFRSNDYVGKLLVRVAAMNSQ
jgi:NADPH-dependent curcumin reductase